MYNYKGLPVNTLVALVFGLRESSRTKMRLSGAKVPMDTYLLAYIADSLAFIAWSKTQDAEKGRNRPRSILESWNDEPSDLASFDTPEDFERARARIIGG